jgi:Mn2+/Fe2+ NRAMP family transporter
LIGAVFDTAGCYAAAAIGKQLPLPLCFRFSLFSVVLWTAVDAFVIAFVTGPTFSAKLNQAHDHNTFN